MCKDLSDSIEISGLEMKCEIIETEQDDYPVESELYDMPYIMRTPGLIKPTPFTIKSLNEETTKWLNRLKESQCNMDIDYSRTDILYKGKRIYNLLIESCEKGIYNCHCDWFKNER